MSTNPDSFSAAEPVVAGNGVSAAVTVAAGAAIQLAQSFGVTVTTAQTLAVMTFVGAFGSLVVAFRSRRVVTPIPPVVDSPVAA